MRLFGRLDIKSFTVGLSASRMLSADGLTGAVRQGDPKTAPRDQGIANKLEHIRCYVVKHGSLNPMHMNGSALIWAAYEGNTP